LDILDGYLGKNLWIFWPTTISEDVHDALSFWMANTVYVHFRRLPGPLPVDAYLMQWIGTVAEQIDKNAPENSFHQPREAR